MDQVSKIPDLIGKTVQIYPNDTRWKFGKIIDLNENGVLFLITRSESADYKKGEIVFISYSANLNFKITC
jgi:hypothetical protein